MALNDRKHTVPGGSENPSRAAIVAGFETVNDIVPVADVTERSTIATAIGPTTARPLYVHRADAPAGQELEVTEDGTTWRPVAGRNAGTQGVLAGTAPPAAQPLLWKTFYAALPLNTNGDGTLTYPGGAFPNGVTGINLIHVSQGAAPSNNLEFVPWEVGLSTANIRCYFGTTVFGGTGVAVSAMIVGW